MFIFGRVSAEIENFANFSFIRLINIIIAVTTFDFYICFCLFAEFELGIIHRYTHINF